jgi:hypothetical protein
MVSLPLIPETATKDFLFPNTISSAFAYIGTYEERTDLNFGEGYWLKFPAVEQVILEGEDRDSIAIDVRDGWNLIGAVSYPIDAGSVTSIPSGIIQSEFFQYNTAYQMSDSIKPFKGYWVKVSSSGKLIMKASVNGMMAKASLDGMSSLSILDAYKNDAKLYFGTGKDINTSRYELPPLPPSGMYDVRYNTGRMVAVVNEEEGLFPIKITGAAYPVNISWDKTEPDLGSYLLIDGKVIEMGSIGEATVRSESTQVILRLGLKASTETPKEYRLDQNYPNPFNPITTINYQLPIESRVTLKIYNVLGQEVITLADKVQSAGNESIIWNSSNTASGVYFYRIEAISTTNPSKIFTHVKKMVLVR